MIYLLVLKTYEKSNTVKNKTVIFENKNIRIQTCLHFEYTYRNSKVILKGQ